MIRPGLSRRYDMNINVDVLRGDNVLEDCGSITPMLLDVPMNRLPITRHSLCRSGIGGRFGVSLYPRVAPARFHDCVSAQLATRPGQIQAQKVGIDGRTTVPPF